MDVVDAGWCEKNPVTGKRTVPRAPPPAEKVANATAVVVQASVDAGDLFGQGVVFTYPSPTDVPEDDPSS